MDHYPGSEIVDRVHETVEAGGTVNVYIQGFEKSIRVAKIAQDGSFAHITGNSGQYIIRLDHLVGYYVSGSAGYDMTAIL